MNWKQVKIRYTETVSFFIFILLIISCCINMESQDYSCKSYVRKAGSPDAFEESLMNLSDAWIEQTTTRKRICLHGMWKFTPASNRETQPPDFETPYYGKVPGRWLSVMYYHTFKRMNDQLVPVQRIDNKELFSYFDGWYSRIIDIPGDLRNKTLLITIDYIGASSSEIYVNDCLLKKTILESENSYGLMQRVTIDITKFSHFSSVKLDIFLHFEKYKVPTDIQGLSLDYIFLHGLESPLAVKDCFIMPSVRKKNINVDIDIYNLNKIKAQNLTLKAFIYNKEDDILVKETDFYPFSPIGGEIENVHLEFGWNDPEYWDIYNPHLYYMKVRLFRDGNLIDESYKEVFGFREFWEQGGDFFLNGKKIHLFNFSSADEIFARYHYLYCRENTIADTINSVKNTGYNSGLTQISWSYRYGGDDSYQGYSPTYLKTVFNASDEMGFYWILSTPYLSWNMDTDLYKNEVRKHIRMWGNHPSIIMHCATFNTSGYPWAQHPGMAGNLEYEPAFAHSRRDTARLSEQIIKEIDPTREVYHNYSGNLNNIYTTMHYLSFGLPLQEREDWPSLWSTTKKTAFFASEFGLPYRGQFLDFDGPEGWLSGKTLVVEHAARYFGDYIYKDALTPLVFTNPGYTTRKDIDVKKGEILNPVFSRIKKLFMTSHIRAWRGYDVSGLGIFGEENEIFNSTFEQYQLTGIGYSTIKSPGLKPDVITVPNRVSHLDKPNELAFVLKDALSPVKAWIGGEEGNFNNKDHSYVGGENIYKQAILLNDTLTSLSVQYTVELIKDQRSVNSLAGAAVVDPGGQKRIPFVFPAPLSDRRENYTLLLKVSGSECVLEERVLEDRFAIEVFPVASFIPENITLGLIDTAGKTRGVMNRMGVRYVDIEDIEDIDQLDEIRLLIIGRESLDDSARILLQRIEEKGLFKRGLHLLVFEQPGSPVAGLMFEETSQRYVFIHDREHPVVKDLLDVDFINFRGSSDLIPAFSEVDRSTETSPHYPHYKWKWGNTGIVATNVIKKPTFGNFHAILGCGFDLSDTPLCETVIDNSMIIFCQLDVTNRYNKDPVSTLLVHHLISYFYSLKNRVMNSKKSLLLSDDQYRDLFTSQYALDADIAKQIDDDLDAYDILVIAGNNVMKNLDMNRINNFVENGGAAFIIPDTESTLEGFPFNVTLENTEIFKGIITGNDNLVSGLGNCDFYFRTLKPVTMIRIENAMSILDTPVIVNKKYGKGEFIFCGMTLDNFKPKKAGAPDYISFIDIYTFHKAKRIINTLLKNCGAGFRMPSVFHPESRGKLYMENFPLYDVNAFHNW